MRIDSIRRQFLVVAVLGACVLGVTLFLGSGVEAGTDVTITKSDTLQAYASDNDGVTYRYVRVYDTGAGPYLLWYVYDYSTYSYVEYGYGYISEDDVSISKNGVSLDVDTTGLTILYGSGGQITLTWTPDGLNSSETHGKTWTRTASTKQISFTGSMYDSAATNGTMFGDDVNMVGYIQTSKGKVILQMKAP